MLNETLYLGRGPDDQFTVPHQYEPISEDDLDFIRQNLDLELEASLGYEL